MEEGRWRRGTVGRGKEGQVRGGQEGEAEEQLEGRLGRVRAGRGMWRGWHTSRSRLFASRVHGLSAILHGLQTQGLSSAAPPVIKALSEAAALRRLPAGTILYEEHTRAESQFVVLAGAVQVGAGGRGGAGGVRVGVGGKWGGRPGGGWQGGRICVPEALPSNRRPGVPACGQVKRAAPNSQRPFTQWACQGTMPGRR